MHVHPRSKTHLFNLHLSSNSEYLSALNSRSKMESETKDGIPRSETKGIMEQELAQ